MRCQELGFAVLVVATLTMAVMYLYMNPAGAGFTKSAYTTPRGPILMVQEREHPKVFEKNKRVHRLKENRVKHDPDFDRDHHHLWKQKTWSTSRNTPAKAKTQGMGRHGVNEKGDGDDFDNDHYQLWKHRERGASRITTRRTEQPLEQYGFDENS